MRRSTYNFEKTCGGKIKMIATDYEFTTMDRLDIELYRIKKTKR